MWMILNSCSFQRLLLCCEDFYKTHHHHHHTDSVCLWFFKIWYVKLVWNPSCSLRYMKKMLAITNISLIVCLYFQCKFRNWHPLKTCISFHIILLFFKTVWSSKTISLCSNPVETIWRLSSHLKEINSSILYILPTDFKVLFNKV